MALARNVSSKQAAGYYEKDDYYMQETAAPSSWHGAGAERLGLSGVVCQQTFHALANGELPDGTRLHRGGSNVRRAATDFEFSAPKSFSIQALALGDKRLIRIHQFAVAAARERIEATTATRVMCEARASVEVTRNAVIAEFLHATSRSGDPDLHSHVVALNLTQRSDRSWRSVDNTATFHEQRLMYAIYLAELAKGARGLGYQISRGKHGNPELAHISRVQIEAFSRRSAQLETTLAAAGLDRRTATIGQKRAAALATRSAKKQYNRAELALAWQRQAADVGLQPSLPRLSGGHAALEHGLSEGAARAAAKVAVQFALNHLGEREASFPRREVLLVALRESLGAAGYRDIENELYKLEQCGTAITCSATARLTTAEALAIERRILNLESHGRCAVVPVASAAQVSRLLADKALTVGQADAVRLALTTSNTIVGIQGLAGTGKTTALRIVVERATQAGFEVIGLAPSHSAVAALTQCGIKSRTLQGWLSDRQAVSTLSPKSVLILDEAGLAGNRNLLSSLDRAHRFGARVILVGDSKQYQSVDSGRAFTQLQCNGMATAQLREMMRQRDRSLAAAARLSVEEPARALEHLTVREIPDAELRYKAIANDYADLRPEQRQASLVLTGTNASRRSINDAIRAELQESGELAGPGITIRVFVRQDLTEAEKKRLDPFEAGALIRFEKTYRSLGVESGDVCTVIGLDQHHVVARSESGRTVTFSPARISGRGLTIGSLESRDIAPGELVRVTQAQRALGVHGGTRGLVRMISNGCIAIECSNGKDIQLDGKRILPLDYGYAATGHSAQGLGAERVFLERDTAARTTDHRSFYTDLTRASQQATVYTNDARALPLALCRAFEKSAALDVVENGTDLSRDSILNEQGLDARAARRHNLHPLEMSAGSI